VPRLGYGNTLLSTERIPTEDEEQMLFVQWFRRSYPDVRIFAIPNGGYRSTSQAALLKATGVSAGVPDLFIPEWKLWIEMKRIKGGTVSQDQKDWIKYLNDIGHTAIVCKGFEEAKSRILSFN
jgi:VRR-NUC domain